MNELLNKKLEAVTAAFDSSGRAAVRYQKLVEGISTVMMGAMMLLDSVDVSATEAPSASIPSDASGAAQEAAEAAAIAEDGRSAKTAPAAQETPQTGGGDDAPLRTVTHDELITLITAKIKENRANQGRIKELLDQFNVARVSDLPPEKCGELKELIAGLSHSGGNGGNGSAAMA